MKQLKTALLTTVALMATACASDEHKDHEHDKKHAHKSEADIHLMDCAIQQTIPGAKATGAFLTIHKHGDKTLSLVSAKAASVTDHVEIHEMIMKNGAMKMSQIQEFPLKDGDNVFKKGGYHIMLMDLNKPLMVGEKHPLTLTFSDGASQTCEAEVKSVEALTPEGMKMDHHDHDGMKHDEHDHDHDKKMEHKG